MRIRHSTSSGDEKVQLQMTPMIDIVFQLLVFFIYSLKIAGQEGDFNVKMPLAAPAAGPPSAIAVPPMKIRLRSDPEGRLAAVELNGRALAARDPLEALRLEIIAVLGDDYGPGSIRESAEVEFDFDYRLHYEHVIQAITAVSGWRDPEGNIVKLVEKIKFAPPRDAPSNQSDKGSETLTDTSEAASPP
jgi:biopolymer transport protein ExbD